MATAKLMGASVKRREDPRFMTGKGNYVDDLKLPGMTYAAFVRSPHAHAKIGKIDTAKALKYPGVVAVFTGKDMTGVNSLPCGWLLPDLKVPPHMPLASDAARYVGDPVAIVIAENQTAALDAAELVAVDWDVKPSVTRTDKAAAKGAPAIHAVAPDNVVGRPGEYLTIDLQGFALGYAAVYLGIGEVAFEYMAEMARTKTQRPSIEPMSHHPLVQRTVAEVGTQIRAARLLLHEAACVKMAGDREATMLAVNQAKAYCADVGLMATERAMRMAGGRGILKELPLERWHRDALAGIVPYEPGKPVEEVQRELKKPGLAADKDRLRQLLAELERISRALRDPSQPEEGKRAS